MATFEIHTKEYIFTLRFQTKDAFMATTLGCHAGTLGGFGLEVKSADPNKRMLFVPRTKALVEYARKNDVYRKIMDWLVTGSKDAWGGWTSPGTVYINKSHWILSAPWNWTQELEDNDPLHFGTAEAMDLIEQFCRHEPEKYGQCVMTVATDCVAHSNNYHGGPATRTMIWHPPHVPWVTNRTRTRVSGFYTPPVPKKGSPQRPVPMKKVKPIKKLPPRPARKEYVASKRAPKYGPQKYSRAA